MPAIVIGILSKSSRWGGPFGEDGCSEVKSAACLPSLVSSSGYPMVLDDEGGEERKIIYQGWTSPMFYQSASRSTTSVQHIAHTAAKTQLTTPVRVKTQYWTLTGFVGCLASRRGGHGPRKWVMTYDPAKRFTYLIRKSCQGSTKHA